jgi:hypothetical protein
MPVILAVRRLGEEDCEFKATLSYIGSLRPAWVTRFYPKN